MSEKYQNIMGPLAELLRGYVVKPDPVTDACGIDDQIADRDSVERLAIDRGVPRKLAREVANKKPDHHSESTHALREVVKWMPIAEGKAQREVLVLCGERGLGKSYAAAQALARFPTGQGCPRWANARHVADWLHSGFPSQMRDLQRVKTAPMLVLDDLGWEHLDRAGFIRGALIGLIDDRIQTNLRTIITANMSEAEFIGRYGDALHDRVRGYGLWVDVESGPSMR